MKTIKINSVIGISAIIIAMFMFSAEIMAQEVKEIKVRKTDVKYGRNWRATERTGEHARMRAFSREEKEPGARLIKMIDLTEEQVEKMKALRLKNQKKSLKVKNELGEKKAKYKTLATDDKVDMKAVNKVIDDIAKLIAKQMKLKAAYHQAIRSELTDNQRIRFDTMIDHFGEGMLKMKQMRAKRLGQVRKTRINN